MRIKDIVKQISHILPDRLYLQIRYFKIFRKPLNLRKPRTYSEKLQWLKLYDRKPEYTRMVDKCEAKKYVAERIGEAYIIPTLGVWDHFDDIDFDALPEKFVLKCTHDSGGLVICTDKASFDKGAARTKIEECLKRNYYWDYREWPYKDVKPRIIAETYMADGTSDDLKDYKFFAFDGEVKALFIASERNSQEETKFDFFDKDFQHLNFTNGHPNADVLPEKPENFELMKTLAAELSKGIAQLRIDFYEANGKVYFGELTFFHWSGMMPFEPESWDETFGSWIRLPKKER